MNKRYTNEELIVLLLNHMAFPDGVNDQITDAVTQTIQAIVKSDESFLEILHRRETRITEDTMQSLADDGSQV